MGIEELSIGQEVTLEAKNNVNELQFSSSIVGIDDSKHAIYTEPIEKDGKILTFNGVTVDLIISVPNDKPILFRNVAVVNYRTEENRLLYKIRLKGQGMVYNRRNAYRCFVGSRVTVQFGTHHSTVAAILKDVSSSGFGLVVTKNELGSHELNIGMLCHTVLIDVVDQFSKVTINLHGTVVRITEIDEERIVFGCELVLQAYELDKYIRTKERMNLAKRQMNSRKRPDEIPNRNGKF